MRDFATEASNQAHSNAVQPPVPSFFLNYSLMNTGTAFLSLYFLLPMTWIFQINRGVSKYLSPKHNWLLAPSWIRHSDFPSTYFSWPPPPKNALSSLHSQLPEGLCWGSKALVDLHHNPVKQLCINVLGQCISWESCLKYIVLLRMLPTLTHQSNTELVLGFRFKV